MPYLRETLFGRMAASSPEPPSKQPQTAIDPDQCDPDPEMIARGKEFFLRYPRDNVFWRGLSRATVFAVGSFSKFFTRGLHNTDVLNSETYFRLAKECRAEKRGLITVMNHISILDDPLVWGGTLPLRVLGTPSKMRWTLGAQDIVFRNKFESTFFSLGQVLGVERFGRGPDQPAIDCATSLVSKGKWVHVYPEGFVHQPYHPYTETLRYFHWGVSRIILESGPKQPVVLPIYGRGLSDIFPEDLPKKAFGYGRKCPILYAFGEPIKPEIIGELRVRWQELKRELKEHPECENSIHERMWQLRSETASLVRRSVLATKHEYFGAGEYDEDPQLNDPFFWRDQQRVRLKGKSMVEKLEKHLSSSAVSETSTSSETPKEQRGSNGNPNNV